MSGTGDAQSAVVIPTRERFVAQLGTLLLLLTTLLLALVSVPPVVNAGLRANLGLETHTSPVLLTAAALLGAIGVAVVERFEAQDAAVRAGALAVTGFVVAQLVRACTASLVVPVGVATAVFLAVWYHPEWYVVDAVLVVACASVAVQIGVSLSPGAAAAALVGVAVFDAYSVYGAGTTQSLVEGAVARGIPVAFVVPSRSGVSLLARDDETSIGSLKERTSVLGFGDAVFGGMFVASVGHAFGGSSAEHVVAPLVAGIPSLHWPALGAVAGVAVGKVLLGAATHDDDRAHAAMPVLAPLLLVGYLAGAFVAGIPLSAALAV